MFNPIPGGSYIEVEGLKCHIPPVGTVFNHLTQKFEKTEIIQNSGKAVDQKWIRKPIPEWYENIMKEVEIKRRLVPKFHDRRCAEYENQEMMRRLNGVWIMLKGKPYYLTGMHYFFLQWWPMDDGYGSFRYCDLEYFYFIEYCNEDPKCFGSISVEKRRNGKSFRASVWMAHYVTMMLNKVGGIQSKTEDDAEAFFAKTIITPFNELPAFMKPIADTSGGITPKKEIRFTPTPIKGKNATDVLSIKTIGSKINCKSAKKAAYDGQKVHRYIADECGKTEIVDVVARHETVRYCVLNHEGKLIGKMLYCTTIEKLEATDEGVNDAFKRLWTNSDQSVRQKSGRTKSGLYRFFMSAVKTRCVDEYGFPDEKRARIEIEELRAEVIDDPKEYGERMRKEPIVIEDAFYNDGEKCMFNSFKLNQQRSFLVWNKNILERGNLVWKNGVADSEVVWEPNAQGRWSMPKGFKFLPEDRNQVEKVGTTFKPKNNYRFGSGVDPYDHNVTVDKNKRSMAASFVKQKQNLSNMKDPFIDTYVCRYFGRPATAALMYEDMIKQCFYFGCGILIENNKINMLRYFENRGYAYFLLRMPGLPDAGIPSTPGNKQTACDFVEAMIENHSEKICYISLIEDLLIFDINDTRVCDEAMAMLWTEMACQNKKYNKPPERNNFTDIDSLFPKHSIAA